MTKIKFDASNPQFVIDFGENRVLAAPLIELPRH